MSTQLDKYKSLVRYVLPEGYTEVALENIVKQWMEEEDTPDYPAVGSPEYNAVITKAKGEWENTQHATAVKLIRGVTGWTFAESHAYAAHAWSNK